MIFSLICAGILLDVGIGYVARESYASRCAGRDSAIRRAIKVPDVWIARIGLLFLGLIALAALITMGIISVDGREIPPAIAGLGGSAASTLGVVVIALIRVGNGKNPPSAQL